MYRGCIYQRAGRKHEYCTRQVQLTATPPGGSATVSTLSATTLESVVWSVAEASYPDGTVVLAKARTKGAASTWSEWSEDVQTTVYHKAYTSISVSNATPEGEYGLQINRLPAGFDIGIGAGGGGSLSQSVLEWRMQLKTHDAVEYTDVWGNDAVVAAGEVVAEMTVPYGSDDYSAIVQHTEVTALDAVFVNGAVYEATAYALMDSGLEAEPSTVVFEFAYDGTGMNPPSGAVTPFPDWSAGILPVCTTERRPGEDERFVYDADVLRLDSLPDGYDAVVVSYIGEDAESHEHFWVPGELPDALFADSVEGMATVTAVAACKSADHSDRAELEGQIFAEHEFADAQLSVYRIERNGDLYPVAEGVPNTSGVLVVDRHPTFGAMEYRIVANDLSTDEMASVDIAGENDWKSILVQWAESERTMSGYEEDDSVDFDFEWVELPWNIRVTQSSAKDVALKSYIGRQHPVALYGTQVGDTGSWSCEIVKNEEDFELRQLRKLSAYMGNCWVREPSGLSYPANVNATVTRSYDSLAVTVDLEVSRVDGYELD